MSDEPEGRDPHIKAAAGSSHGGSTVIGKAEVRHGDWSYFHFVLTFFLALLAPIIFDLLPAGWRTAIFVLVVLSLSALIIWSGRVRNALMSFKLWCENRWG